MQEAANLLKEPQNALPSAAPIAVAINPAIPNPNSDASNEVGHHILSWIVNLSGLPVSKDNIASLYSSIKENKILLGGLVLLGIFLMRHKIGKFCDSLFGDKQTKKGTKKRIKKTKEDQDQNQSDVLKNSNKNKTSALKLGDICWALDSAASSGVRHNLISNLKNCYVLVEDDFLEKLTQVQQPTKAEYSMLKDCQASCYSDDLEFSEPKKNDNPVRSSGNIERKPPQRAKNYGTIQKKAYPVVEHKNRSSYPVASCNNCLLQQYPTFQMPSAVAYQKNSTNFPTISYIPQRHDLTRDLQYATYQTHSQGSNRQAKLSKTNPAVIMANQTWNQNYTPSDPELKLSRRTISKSLNSKQKQRPSPQSSSRSSSR